MKRHCAAALLTTVAAFGCGQGPTTELDSPAAAAQHAAPAVQPGVPSIDVSSPPSGSVITSPVYIRGETLNFDVSVAVCDANGQELGRAIFVVGPTTTLLPFGGPLTFATPASTNGTIELVGRTSEGGPFRATCGGTNAVTVPVRFTSLSFTG